MKPGRELDALVAEKVMGWRLLKKMTIPPNPVDENNPVGLPPGAKDDGHSEWTRVPNYSTSIADAWSVVEEAGVLALYRHPDGWRAVIGRGDYSEDGETAPHAICLAALKAVGAEL